LLAAPKVGAEKRDAHEIQQYDREVEWADSHRAVPGRSRDANRPLRKLSSKLKEINAQENLQF
jgi:hypothetical protein